MAAFLHTEGRQYILECAFTEEQAPPANFYMGLATDAGLAENATLASLTEVSGTGYARQPIASSTAGFTSATGGTNDRKVVSTTAYFAAEGTWTAAKTVFLATSVDGAGKLIASAPLSQTLTLNNLDELAVAIAIQLNDA